MASTWVRIRNTIEGIAVFGAKYVFPVAASFAASAGFRPWAGVLIVNIVPALMAAVETMHTEPGTGPVKKQQVLDAAAGMMAVLEQTFTGGAAVNFDKIKPTLSILIDQTIAMVNDLMPEIIANDGMPPGPPVVGSGIDAPLSGA